MSDLQEVEVMEKFGIRRLKKLTKECVKKTEELSKKAGIKNDKLKAEIFGALLLAKLIGGEGK